MPRIVGLLSPVLLMVSTAQLVRADELPKGGESLTQIARQKVVDDVAKAHLVDFTRFKAIPGIDLSAARAAIRADISDLEYAEAKARSTAYNNSLKVVATVQVPVPNSKKFVSYDCVPAALLPSAVAASAAKPEAPPADAYGAVSAPETESTAPKAASLSSKAPPPVFKMPSKSAACPLGTVALRRTTLAELLASPATKVEAGRTTDSGQRLEHPGVDRSTYRALLGRVATPPPAGQQPYRHRYAHAAAIVANTGVRSRLNVWSPRVLDGDMSLSQVWIVGGDPDQNSLQTVEAGWQVMRLWESPFSAIFVYSTADNYISTGCYATKCGVNVPQRPESFHFTTNKVIIGAPIQTQSVVGGNQGTVEIRWIRNPSSGSWWLKVNGDWVGYYPVEAFAGGPLSGPAAYVDFGGEATGYEPTSEMGSGRFAHEGRGRAAFQSKIQYLDLQGVARQPQVQPDATDVCYSISAGPPGVDPEPDPGAYIYFGGPGTRHFESPPTTPGQIGPCEGPPA